jgi:hypothetical protein
MLMRAAPRHLSLEINLHVYKLLRMLDSTLLIHSE